MFINYRLEDGSTVLVEVTEETAAYILDNDREMTNADRKERYHCPYHIEAMEYEGDSLAYRLTPEEIFVRKEEQEHISDTLSCLTDVQLRRLTMKADGMTLRKLPAAEGTTVNAVMESLEAAKKNSKTFLKHLYKTTCFSPYSEGLDVLGKMQNAMNKLMKGGRPDETHHHLYGKLQG